jgi:hypothetical protein
VVAHDSTLRSGAHIAPAVTRHGAQGECGRRTGDVNADKMGI